MLLKRDIGGSPAFGIPLHLSMSNHLPDSVLPVMRQSRVVRIVSGAKMVMDSICAGDCEESEYGRCVEAARADRDGKKKERMAVFLICACKRDESIL